MPNGHPILVHFPVALLSISLLFDLLALVGHREDFARTGWWTQLAGTVGLAFTVVTGLFAEKQVGIIEGARATFEAHQQFAFATAAVYGGLLIWRLGARTRISPRQLPLYAALSACGVVLMWLAAWNGGEMVYAFGVGVSPR